MVPDQLMVVPLKVVTKALLLAVEQVVIAIQLAFPLYAGFPDVSMVITLPAPSEIWRAVMAWAGTANKAIASNGRARKYFNLSRVDMLIGSPGSFF